MFFSKNQICWFPCLQPGGATTLRGNGVEWIFQDTNKNVFFQTLGMIMIFGLLEIMNLAILVKTNVPRVVVKGNILTYEPNNESTLIWDMAESQQNRRSMLQYKQN